MFLHVFSADSTSMSTLIFEFGDQKNLVNCKKLWTLEAICNKGNFHWFLRQLVNTGTPLARIFKNVVGFFIEGSGNSISELNDS